MPAALQVLLVGLIYTAGFCGLSLARRQGFPARFAVESLGLSAAATALALARRPPHLLLFLVVLYLATMRVRLAVDLGNWLSSRGRHARALGVFRLALRLGPDPVSRKIVLINRGVVQLRMQEAEAAYFTLRGVLLDTPVSSREAPLGARYVAAGFYNLGLASRRSGRGREAERYFQQAIATLPGSIYAEAARRALQG